jgi:hypothetical protein
MLPPHSSDKTQALDLGLFGITKQVLTKVRVDPEKSPQSNQLIRMLSAWHVAARISLEAFADPGLSCDGRRAEAVWLRRSFLEKRIVRKSCTCMSKKM